MKALLGPRGKKLRTLERTFVADGLQSLRSALVPQVATAPLIELLYLTEGGLGKLRSEFSQEIIDRYEVIMVSDQVMSAMADTQSPQGILALCKYLPTDLTRFSQHSLHKVAYFWQIQDPGNAGTAIRTADACGFDLVIFSDQSVDIYSPKVVRSTAGSLWNIPVIDDVPLDQLEEFSYEHNLALVALDGGADQVLSDVSNDLKALTVSVHASSICPPSASGPAPSHQGLKVGLHGQEC